MVKNQEAYSLQRPLRRQFRRNKIMVTGIDDQWSADLTDMVKFAKYNDGYMYILVVIDVLSKYVWMRPLKDKKGISVAHALWEIFLEGRVPKRIRTDKGQEFRSKEVQKVFNGYDGTHLYAQNETKAAVAERVIKTVKTRIYRFMTYQQSYEYIDKLQTFVKSYNNSYHRTIGMAPKSVNSKNETAVWWRMNPFFREYDEKWTGEIFIISQRILRGGLPVYRVKDFDEEEIRGTFYQSELQKVDIKEDDLWKGVGHCKVDLGWLSDPSFIIVTEIIKYVQSYVLFYDKE
ncbi:SCAN domain-containing protein 3-like [Saccostrea cucullata]|uniref:SCAN domain-containing protein 3-like n=1 Tax=Saccostrea cuccullata TaxID=36930 RepID=UPI002ED5D45A